MTIHDLVNLGIKKLSKTSPALDAEVLLTFVLNKPKEYLLINSNKKIDPRKEKTFLKLIKQRSIGVPIAYLTGKKEFFGLNFFLDKNVLVPRPDTEVMVEAVLKINSQKPLSILDIGTGSGNIIISLAKNGGLKTSATKTKFSASDVSARALSIARRNAKQHKVKISFKQGSLLKPWGNQNFDVIIANLPYGWKQWKNKSSAETIGLKFEPKLALFTSKNGLFLIEELLRQISERKSKPKYVFLEFDPRQSNQIKNLAKKYLPGYETKISKDLSNRIRYATLEKK